MATPTLKLNKGEVLFKEGDVASSLFIIKKGQLRLYKDKGDGIVDIAILKAGEVCGEMAYFDNDSGRRNCSASPITELEYAEIAFSNFSKVIENLNPWFKTIIKTLVDRLNKSNHRIKSLEATSVVNYSNGENKLTSINAIDLSKILSTLFLCFKAYGEFISNKYSISKKTFNLYAKDVYSISEVKTEQVLEALKSINVIFSVKKDNDEVIVTSKLEDIKLMFLSFNAERHLIESKKIKLSQKGYLLLVRIWEKIENKSSEEEFIDLEISSILASLKKHNITINDFSELRDIGFVKSVLVDSNNYSVLVNFQKIAKDISFLKLKNYFYK